MSSRSASEDVERKGVPVVKTSYSELLEIAKGRYQAEKSSVKDASCGRGRRDPRQYERGGQVCHKTPTRTSEDFHLKPKTRISSSDESVSVRMSLKDEVRPNPKHSKEERTESKQGDSREGGVLFVNYSKLQDSPRKKKPSHRMNAETTESEELSVVSSDTRPDLSRLEERLSGALARWNRRPSTFPRIAQICSEIRDAHLQCLMDRLQLFLKETFSSRLWKKTHYLVIEALRGDLASNRELEGIYVDFLADTCGFYEKAVKNLEKKHSFSVVDLVSGTVDYSSKEHKSQVARAKVVCHQFYLSLGDLSRYLEQTKPKQDWTRTKNYYTRAQQLAPKIGWTYHQQAVVAINAQRRMDAVYYYVRSLMASSPVPTARESLLGLLHDLSSKDNHDLGQLASEVKVKEQSQPKHAKRKGKPGKKEDKEIWIFPTKSYEEVKMKMETASNPIKAVVGSAKTKQKKTVFESFNESEPPPPKLLKQLTQCFLAVHGKMFTKIQHQTLNAAVKMFLSVWEQYLCCVLKESELTRSSMMVVVTLFSIHNAAGDRGSGRVHSMGVAAQFLLSMVASVIQCCLAVLRRNGLTSAQHSDLHSRRPHPPSPLYPRPTAQPGDTMGSKACRNNVPTPSTSPSPDPGSVTNDDPALETLPPALQTALLSLSVQLAVVKVTMDWLRCQEDLWSECALEISKTVWFDYMDGLSELLTVLSGLGCSRALPQVCLAEDRMLQGFTPLSDTLELGQICKPDKKQELLLQCLKRVLCIVAGGKKLSSRLGGQLTGHSIQFNEETSQFVCVTSSEGAVDRELGGGEVELRQAISEGPETGDMTVGDAVSKKKVSKEAVSKKKVSTEASDHKHPQSLGEEEGYQIPKDQNHIDSPVDENIQELRAQKHKLAKELEDFTEARKRVKDFISSHAEGEGDARTFICPKYLVPDTNGFIDHLESIVKLVECRHFVITIPLTVLDELDGLAKGPGTAAKDKPKTSLTTEEGAKMALSAMRGWVSAKSSFVRMVTSKGELMTSLGYSTIERTLASASNDDFILASCKSLHERTVKMADKDICVSVILLTDDRNLRVKAHAAGLPGVRDFKAFLMWSKPLLNKS